MINAVRDASLAGISHTHSQMFLLNYMNGTWTLLAGARTKSVGQQGPNTHLVKITICPQNSLEVCYSFFLSSFDRWPWIIIGGLISNRISVWLHGCRRSRGGFRSWKVTRSLRYRTTTNNLRFKDDKRERLLGWWSHKMSTRFQMNNGTLIILLWMYSIVY